VYDLQQKPFLYFKSVKKEEEKSSKEKENKLIFKSQN
jgi:hypothetical protein